MTKHSVNLDIKYFEPVYLGEITLLIFDKQVITDYKEGDSVLLQNSSYVVLKKIKNIEMKSFGDISDDEARKAGFINKDFLQDELVRRFEIDGLSFILGIDDLLLFCVYLEDDNKSDIFTFNSSQFRPVYYMNKEGLDGKEI